MFPSRDKQIKGRSSFPLLLILLLLSLPSCVPTQVKDWEGFTVNGKALDVMGHPVPNAHVYAYQEGKANTLGPADAMSEPTGPDGAYNLILPEGIYIIVARRRVSGSISGPLKSGDMSGQLSEPLHTAQVDHSNFDITLKVFRQGAQGDPKRILTTDTRISGIVVDTSGEALSGMHVFAYEGPFREDPPDYMASSTDGDGRFEISLPGGGAYTIGARTRLRGKPGPDDSMGFWGEKDRPWEIEEGSVTEGVRIVVVPYGDKP